MSNHHPVPCNSWPLNQDYLEMLERGGRQAPSPEDSLALAGGPLGYGKEHIELLNP